MNILILSWRDPYHPLAGGAERITQKYAQYWADHGHQVWWMSASFPKSKQKEILEGVEYQRIGPRLSHQPILNLFFYPLYLINTILAAQSLIKKQKIDKVIDEIHGLPMFSPLYSSGKNVLLVCEVAGPIWNKMYPFPINIIGRLIENFCYQLYQSVPIWAISESTRQDILRINPRSSVKILPLGIDAKDYPKQKKNLYPSAVFIARLVKMKGIEIALEATKKIVQTLPDFQLTIVGKGLPQYETFLRQKIKQLDLEKNVQFLGYVSEEEKYKLLAQSHFLIHPSYKEGFGLTVLEAGLVKTPAIVKKGSSLDELIDDGVDGYIVSDAEGIADKFILGYQSKDYSQMIEAAADKSKRYNWSEILENSAKITDIN